MPTPAYAEEVRRILVLYANNRLLPSAIEFDRELQASVARVPGRRVEFFAEFLETPTFSGPRYEEITATYLGGKYGARQPDVIVVVGKPALDFLLRHEGGFFPGVTVVHAAVDSTYLQSIAPLPARIVGVPVEYDFAGTMALALRWHPNAQRLVVVTGTSASDRSFESMARAAVDGLRPSVPVEFLTGLPHDAVMTRMAALGPRDVVFSPGYFSDGAGRDFTPRDVVGVMAKATDAPIYGPFSSFIGTGVVAGSIPSFGEMARQSAHLLDQLLDAVPPTALRSVSKVPALIHVDWREARKLGITADQIPPDAVIQFKEPTFWEAYRGAFLTAIAVMLAQGVLIAALLIERRQRRQAGRALQASEERMNLAARAARLSMWIWDVGERRAWSLTRFHAHDEEGKDHPQDFDQVLQTLHPDDREPFDRAVRAAIARDEEIDIEYRTLADDGTVRWMSARGRCKPGSTRAAGIAIDITARKSAEMQAREDRLNLTRMARVSTMGQFSASIAHQLNQPLAAILGNAEAARMMLRSDEPDLVELREICEDIVKEDKRAADIIRRLGALFKRGEMKVAPLDLNDLIIETVELIQAELAVRHVVPRLELSDALPAIEADRIQVQQLLLNLILNAADAMSHMHATEHTVWVRTSSDDMHVRLCVVDRGPGISPTEMAKLFDAFWTTKVGGTGVGLAICKSIMTAHRGSLTASNNPEGGATFSASWPIQPPS